MGSSLGLVLANLYMEMFESRRTRYVDIFLCGKSTVRILVIFSNRLNNLTCAIHFKVKWKDSGKLPFRRSLIQRKWLA